MKSNHDFDFRADGRSDATNGWPCVPPPPRWIDGELSDAEARDYLAGYREGRNTALTERKPEVNND